MLQLKGITKDYETGDSKVPALRGIDISFRKSEFVCILGQSGCGKTTLLNIIGGLDHYTEGDLIIDGRSTKEYHDGDWDIYRNHSIGFVFQSYNLIPHQTVLSNVELALTVSGVSKKERQNRAIEALEKVGLRDQLKKKPNQMSGGQMQRVAIARALVNNPEILLADEPTGALDSETSVQVMEILKEISQDKLIIMVTHNPELAKNYASRVIRVLDGIVTDDSNPFSCEKDAATSTAKTNNAAESTAANTAESIADNTADATVTEQKKQPQKIVKAKIGKRQKKKSMRFATALSLSLNNLMTKKGRTILTSFAGSIGIIGIALILSVSSGVQNYIDYEQEKALTAYPITLQSESTSLSEIIEAISSVGEANEEADHALDAVYENQVMYDVINSMNSLESSKNDLKSFKEYIESNREEFNNYTSAISYSYDFNMNIYTRDKDGKLVKSDINELMNNMYGGNTSGSTGGSTSGNSANASGSAPTAASSSPAMSASPFASMTQMNIWEQMIPDENGTGISGALKEQYDIIGNWPTNANEIVLLVDQNNEINDMVLYALGLRTGDELRSNMLAAQNQEQIDTSEKEKWSYDEIMSMTFKMLLSSDCYQKQSDGTYKDMTQTEAGLEYLYNNDALTIPLKVSGIIRPKSDDSTRMISGYIGYTTALTDLVVDRTENAALIKAQMADKKTDVLLGLPFDSGENENLTDAQKAEKLKAYFKTLSTAEKAAMYRQIEGTPTEEYLASAVTKYLAATDAATLNQMLIQGLAEQMETDEATVSNYLSTMDEASKSKYLNAIVSAVISKQYAAEITKNLAALSDQQLATTFDAVSYPQARYAQLFDLYMPQTTSKTTYDENMKQLGYVNKETPSAINFYATTFENKDHISGMIDDYNKKAPEEKKITYTDYIALLMSSITAIISAISYVLIAFVAISLIVSSIMIGIITYISVLERTKEIGILRAIGASKKDVSRVFNAETLIVGFVSGSMGIGITLLLLIPINLIIHALTDISTLNASLPVIGAIILVIISMALTLIAGLIPSSIAKKKDPVEALRTE